MDLLSPSKNLGAKLLLFFTWGSVWSTGYLVRPYLEDKVQPNEIRHLLIITTVFAGFAFLVNLLARLKSFGWKFNTSDVPLQANMAALVLSGIYLALQASQPQAANIAYGFLSLSGIAWVAYLKLE